MGYALTKQARRTSLLASGLLVCASLFVAQAARADDSLWGKAMGAIGLGGAGQTAPDAANPPPAAQPAAPAPQQAAPAAVQPKAKSSSRNPARPVAEAAPPAPVASAPPPAENQNLLTNWFGWGRRDDQSAAGDQVGAPTQAAAQRKAINPVSATDAPAYAEAPSGAGPSMWDKMFGSIGLQTKNVADTINYSERPKLTVPKERSLPGPAQAGSDPAPTRPANTNALVRPPGDYLEKVRGPDGNVSGLRDGDIPKDKKLFGMF
ncbi:hypothetical protein [Rhodoblastus sp.]|uniref:hypothetical protein n=1 Tax=Rhodoblastus sp. TaxID=1962975 RepID=UPI00260DAC65|nr:hypothetical protein [Rhodoblastus sp.]